ncbi:TPA: folylpolyglutamate synthase/dihydrofolate synthase family protein [Streptococcus suis]
MKHIHTYDQALAWIDAQKSLVSRTSLDKIYYALEYLGNPHLSLTTIHIGGTNGKGSTTTYLKEMLKSHGLVVGTFTSPHIRRFNERIGYDGRDISDQELIDLVNHMIPVNDYMEKSPYSRLTFFELYTVMMFTYFSWVKPDVCLIEVGIGGTFDCTNVIKSPYVAISSIGLDHTDKLGNTLVEIADQKAGIIYPGAQVFTGPLAIEALAVIANKCQSEGATLHQFEPGQSLETSLEKGTSFVWRDQAYHIHMLGDHQVANASLALGLFNQWMLDHDRSVDYSMVQAALRESHWPGRMEKIQTNPLIFLDGAHNLQGLMTLGQSINTYFKGYGIHLIYAGLSSKNQSAHIAYLMSLPLTKITFCQFDHSQSMALDEFKYLVQEDKAHPDMQVDFAEDWEPILNSNSDQQVTIVTGSLYFVSQVRNHLLLVQSS